MSATPINGAGGGFTLPPSVNQSPATAKGKDASPAGKAGAAPTSFSSGSIKSETNVGISKRSLPGLAVSAPIYLISGTIAGISAKVNKGSFRAAFTGEMKKLSAQAKGGISDSYKTLKPGKGNAKEIAQQNYRYAGTINGESETTLLDEGEGKWESSTFFCR